MVSSEASLAVVVPLTRNIQFVAEMPRHFILELEVIMILAIIQAFIHRERKYPLIGLNKPVYRPEHHDISLLID